MQHAMIDLETLGTDPSSIFLSIAAVQFDPETGQTGASFKQIVELESAQKAGLTWNAYTLEWWLKQKPETMRKMFVDSDITAMPLREVLLAFTIWMHENDLLCVWGNSARFDLSILEHSYKRMELVTPWSFRNERCYRTLTALLPNLRPEPNGLEVHNPLDDCYYQIARLVMVWRQLFRKSEHSPLMPDGYAKAVELLQNIGVELAEDEAIGSRRSMQLRIQKFLNTLPQTA